MGGDTDKPPSLTIFVQELGESAIQTPMLCMVVYAKEGAIPRLVRTPFNDEFNNAHMVQYLVDFATTRYKDLVRQAEKRERSGSGGTWRRKIGQSRTSTQIM